MRIALVLASLLVACSSANDPAPLDVPPTTTPDATPSDDAAIDDGFSPLGDATPRDAAVDCKLAQKDGTVCACTEVGQDPPTLYLILDRSGSMGEPAPGTKTSKWRMVRDALVGDAGVLRKLGSRVKIAMAWFPGPNKDDVCDAGHEVMHPTIGGKDTYDALQAKLATALPRGATPTAATLTDVAKSIAAIKGPVHALLATDGAPNCGSTTCDASMCTYNLEHAKLFSENSCEGTVNCCDPKNVAVGLGWRACIDGDATVGAAAQLAEQGVKTFVVGVPGTIDAYAAQLDAIAVAGGAPRSPDEAGGKKYWAPTDATSLTDALSAIAGRAIDSCEVRLEKAVDDPGITNVLLDGEPLDADATNGWAWSSDSTIELHGAACDRVKAGTVGRIQVVVGCRTVTK